MNTDDIRRALKTQLAVPTSVAGQALAVGRYRMRERIKAGVIPVTPAGTIPTKFLRAVLLIDDDDGSSQATVERQNAGP